MGEITGLVPVPVKFLGKLCCIRQDWTCTYCNCCPQNLNENELVIKII